MGTTVSSIDNPATLLALKVMKEQAQDVPEQYRGDFVFLISWFLFNPMPIDKSDEIWTMIRNYLSHFTNGKVGEPDFTKLKHEVENDPVVVLERLNMNLHRKILPQQKLASYAGFPNQQTIDRFHTVKKKSIDKIRRMTVVLGLFTGLGRRLL